jgi:ABC-type transport system involved in multi-copper enzyme maturation permease subunit
MSLARMWAIATNGFREVIRDRIFYFVGFFALIMAVALRLLPDISLGSHEKVFLDLGLGIMGFLGPLVAIFVGTGLINKEIEKRTVLVLIPKPLSRAEFILGKHLGLSAVLIVMLATMTVVFFLMLSWAKISYQPGILLISQLYLLLEVSLLIALAMAFGVFTSSILATLLSLGVYLMGHISQNLLELGAISKNSQIESITRLIYLILPDLERLNLRNDITYGILPSSLELWTDAIYGVVYTGLLLGITILVFSRRQF